VEKENTAPLVRLAKNNVCVSYVWSHLDLSCWNNLYRSPKVICDHAHGSREDVRVGLRLWSTVVILGYTCISHHFRETAIYWLTNIAIFVGLLLYLRPPLGVSPAEFCNNVSRM